MGDVGTAVKFLGDVGKDVKAPEQKHINLKVMGQGNAIVRFKITSQTPLGKLMNAYCDRVGLAMQTIRFRFDGKPFTESDTLMSLALKEGDTIEVYQQMDGGGKC